MKSTSLLAFFCFVFVPFFVHGQSTFVRALDLHGSVPKTALHPASGGFVHMDVSNEDLVIAGLSFTRLDSLGQAVQTIVIDSSQGHYFFMRSDLERLAGGGYLGFWSVGTYDLLVKLDDNGVPLGCQHTSMGTSINDLKVTQDGGFFMAGYKADSLVAGWLARMDAQGDSVWTLTISLPSKWVALNSAVELPGGGWVVAGQIEDTAALLGISATGQVQWAKTYTGVSGIDFIPEHLAINQDGQIFLVGPTTTGGFTNFACFDSLGVPQWCRLAYWNNSIQLFDLDVSLQGDPVLGASIYTHGSLTGVASLSCISKTGALVWSRGYTMYDNGRFSDVDALPDGGLLWTGANLYNTLLIRSDTNGAQTGPCSPAAQPVTIWPDTLVSTPFSPVTGHFQMAVVTAATFQPTIIHPNSTDHCATVSAGGARPSPNVQVLPQPMRSTARILLTEGDLADDAQLHITDLSGRSLSLSVTRLPDGFEIERGGLPAGIYAYQVLQEGQRIASGKLWLAD